MKQITEIAASLLVMTSVAGCAGQSAVLPETGITHDADHPPALVEMNFQSHGKRLNGLVYVADGPGPHPTVLLLHGFPGNEKNLDLAQDLRANGFNVLFFHYRGAWGSEGDFSFTHVIEDVASAADHVRTNADTYRSDPGNIILIGHSMGGFAALAAGAKDETIACAAGLAPANFAVVADAISASAEMKAGFSAYGDTLQMLAGTSGDALVRELIENRDAFDIAAIAPEFAGRNVLIIAADEDEAVPLETVVQALMEAYTQSPDVNATTLTLSGDHSFSWSRAEMIASVLDWVEVCR